MPNIEITTTRSGYGHRVYAGTCDEATTDQEIVDTVTIAQFGHRSAPLGGRNFRRDRSATPNKWSWVIHTD